MVWIRATYVFASTFSYRIPYFSSSYALSAPVPSPSTVKLALVASIINRTSDIEAGKKLFERIRCSMITFELPERIITLRAFIKRLKQKRKGQETTIKTSFGELVERFESTFGIREYIIYDGPIHVYIDAQDESVQDVLKSLKLVQYFGSSDSLCTCLETNVSGPDLQKCIRPVDSKIEMFDKKGMIFLLTDFTEKTTFESVNSLSGKKLKKGELLQKPYFFPLEVVKKEKNCTMYRRL